MSTWKIDKGSQERYMYHCNHTSYTLVLSDSLMIDHFFTFVKSEAPMWVNWLIYSLLDGNLRFLCTEATFRALKLIKWRAERNGLILCHEFCWNMEFATYSNRKNRLIAYSPVSKKRLKKTCDVVDWRREDTLEWVDMMAWATTCILGEWRGQGTLARKQKDLNKRERNKWVREKEWKQRTI